MVRASRLIAALRRMVELVLRGHHERDRTPRRNESDR